MTGAGTEATSPRNAQECQERHAERIDKCQDEYATAKTCYEDDSGGGGGVIGGGGGGGGGGGEARGVGDKTHHRYFNSNNNNNLEHDPQQRHQQEGAYQLVPPDGGWGWMVALGTFIVTTLLPMLGPCFGVLFSEYLLGEGSSSTTTAWIFNVQCFLWHMSSLMSWPLTQEFGWRPVGLTGSAMATVGLLISAFTPSPTFLFFSFSFLTGLGGGMVTCQCFIILPHYFLRRRGLATGIMMSGICMGTFLGPPVARFLQDKYSFRGATLILGAITLNSCIGASLFHPFEWHQKKVPLEEEQQEVAPCLLTKDKISEPTDLAHAFVHSPPESPFIGNTEKETDGGHEARMRLLERLEGHRLSCSSSRRLSRYNSTISLSSLDVGSLAALPVENIMQEDQREAQDDRGASLLVRVMKSIMKDLKVIKYLRACIIFLGSTMCINGYMNFIMMVPFAMVEWGFTLDTSAWCVSISACCNMVTRFLVSSLSDWPRFNKRLVYMSGFALMSASIFVFTMLASVKWMMVTMAMFGFGVGANMGLFSIVIMDVMGVERLAPVFGTACFFVALGFIFIGPFIGFIRDLTLSYTVSMRITGGMMLVGLVGWLFMGVAEKVDLRREASKALKKEEQKT